MANAGVEKLRYDRRLRGSAFHTVAEERAVQCSGELTYPDLLPQPLNLLDEHRGSLRVQVTCDIYFSRGDEGVFKTALDGQSAEVA